MLVITIGVPILAFAVAYGLAKCATIDDSKLSEPRADMLTMGVQIICGDCCGDAKSPVKTYLDRSGNCGQCGGRSYMLASSRIVYAQQLIDLCLSSRESDTRLQPIEAQTKLYAVRAHVLTASEQQRIPPGPSNPDAVVNKDINANVVLKLVGTDSSGGDAARMDDKNGKPAFDSKTRRARKA